ncbi:MAG: hypothetical protein Q4G63_11530 [Bacteroidia bacterium]|nr:hypothetical protein [Bacteroidia bacterium]
MCPTFDGWLICTRQVQHSVTPWVQRFVIAVKLGRLKTATPEDRQVKTKAQPSPASIHHPSFFPLLKNKRLRCVLLLESLKIDFKQFCVRL